jgi:large subunit ribosomal protein L24e
MVVKRSCSFCAGEIEPGTGMMFVKRDGSIFHFCSSSCRKQQLHLGRVGHRLKWTRAHAIKRQTEQSSAAGRAAGKHKPAVTRPSTRAPTTTGPAKESPAEAPKVPPAPEPTLAAEPAKAEEASTAKSEKVEGTAAAAPKKPRARKPKDAAESPPPS